MKQINILDFIHFCEKLKFEFRNSITSTGKKESVAEHSWRVGLMVMLIGPHLDRPISVEKALKISIIHDLAEAITGDEPYYKHEGQESLQLKKTEKEIAAMNEIQKKFELPEEFIQLWNEFEFASSYEGKFVKALDKMEAQIQHNEADFDIWNDFDLNFAKDGLDKYCIFDKVLTEFKKLIQLESLKKISESNPEN